MCVSEEVSLATFLIGTFGSIFMWIYGKDEDRIFGVIFGFIVLMQGVEFLLWRYQRCDSWHRAVSLTGAWINILQPVVAGLAIIALAPNVNPWIWAVMGAYLAVIVPYVLRFQGDLRCTTPRPGNPHLVWGWTNMPGNALLWLTYLAAFIGVMYLGLDHRTAHRFTAVFLASLALTALVYPRESVGSIWCVAAALVPVGYLIQNKIRSQGGA
jgi:hypothetical protein